MADKEKEKEKEEPIPTGNLGTRMINGKVELTKPDGKKEPPKKKKKK